MSEPLSNEQKRYRVVRMSAPRDLFEREITNLMEQGWVPTGGIHVAESPHPLVHDTLTQAMVRT